METGLINPHFLLSEADFSVWKLLQLPALSWDPSASARRCRGSQLFTNWSRKPILTEKDLPNPTHACRKEC